MTRVRNEAEEAVRFEVDSLRAGGGGGTGRCWCALCEADVVALALTMLPPRYSTVSESSRSHSGAVRSAVSTALRRVAKRPKHHPASPERQVSKVRVVNFIYEECASLVSTLTRRPDLICGCPRCLDDTLAFALNRYPPKYGVLHAGRENLPSWQRNLMRFELQSLVSHAVGKVAAAPRHGTA